MSDLADLARANGFDSVTEAITVARQSRVKIARLSAALKLAIEVLEDNGEPTIAKQLREVLAGTS